MTDEQVAGQTIVSDLDTGEVSTNTPGLKRILNPVTQRVIELAIQEVLSEYSKQTKQFTADSMHGIRVKVTEIVKQRLGADEVDSVDIGLDLTNVAEIPFFFKVNIPTSKSENHFMDIPIELDEKEVQAAVNQMAKEVLPEASSPEEFKKLAGS